MSNDILYEAREYLVAFLRGKANKLETRHPWRREWQHIVLHSLRVESYVVRLLEEEPHSLTESERRSLRLAAILHDIGRLEKTENHATTGAEIVGMWFRADPLRRLPLVEVQRVVELIADHSNKDRNDSDFSKAVLKDADILDEVGAMSIFMAGNWLDMGSPFFFYDLRQRLLEVEIPFCYQQLSRLRTAAAKKLLNGKKAFVENFIAQMGDELRSEVHVERLLLARKKITR